MLIIKMKMGLLKILHNYIVFNCFVLKDEQSSSSDYNRKSGNSEVTC